MSRAVFPGRFQPFTNAHLSRLRWIQQSYPNLTVVVVIGDMGSLSHDNFLRAEERQEMVEDVIAWAALRDVATVVVPGVAPPFEWAASVLKAVPGASVVVTDNPFAYEPLAAAGLKVVTYERTGVGACSLRLLPFADWEALVPQPVFDYIAEHALYQRLAELPFSGRYPFLRMR